MAGTTQKDAWNAQAYSDAASFVPLLTSKVVSLLDPQPDGIPSLPPFPPPSRIPPTCLRLLTGQPTDTILDLGCGDGVLTSALAQRCTHITGLDSSSSMIARALASHSTPNSTYQVTDCASLPSSGIRDASGAPFSKVFSNAALHWILRTPTAAQRVDTLAAVAASLQPGGVFVAEAGGKGNVAEVHGTLIGALVHRGIPVEKAREASPWFFPEEVEMKGLLEEAGFAVEVMESEYRPTKLNVGEKGGLQGWVRLFGKAFLEVLLDEGQRDAVVKEVVDVLKDVCGRSDGGWQVGYVRLRFVARKKASYVLQSRMFPKLKGTG